MKTIGTFLSLAAFALLAACGDDAVTAPQANTCTTPVSASAQVTVTTPNCGGTWKVGDTVSLAWKVGADFNSALIRVVLPNGHMATVYNNSVSTPAYRWAIPDSIYDDVVRAKVSTVGSGYKLVISEYTDRKLLDSSDVAFSIVAK